MKLYFTRHGKTEWNLEKRFQGMTGDSPLLPDSYAEIARLGQHIKDLPFEKIYSSSSKRAQDTAQGIATQLSNPVEILYSDDLRELGLGDLEGQKVSGVDPQLENVMHNLRYHLDRYDPTEFHGEPIEEAIQRIAAIIQQAVSSAKQGPLLFVGHGASMTAAIQWLAGKDLSELRDHGGLLNNSLTILETQEPENNLPYKMLLWNDTSFLGKDSQGKESKNTII